MPIYAYRCERCGHAKDVLQRMSDPVLTVCPSCGQDAFRKQVTAAGFQLKGSGWYVTDFRGDKPSGKGSEGDASAGKPGDPVAGKSGSAAPSDASPAAAPAPAPSPAAESSPSPPPAAAPGKTG